MTVMNSSLHSQTFFLRVTVTPDGQLWIHNISRADEGKYTCFAENYLGKANSTGHLSVRGRYLLSHSSPLPPPTLTHLHLFFSHSPSLPVIVRQCLYSLFFVSLLSFQSVLFFSPTPQTPLRSPWPLPMLTLTRGTMLPCSAMPRTTLPWT